MADNVALGVRNSGADGTTPLALRLALAALFPQSGILSGLGVSGSSSLAYSVAAGVAVCTRGAGDGSAIATVAAGSTPAVAANGTGYPRIDAVWVAAHDIDQGDPDNHVALGVTQGTAAASPARPTVPTYATLLAYMRLPAGATTTAQATVEACGRDAVAAGATMGQLGYMRDTYDGKLRGNFNSTMHTDYSVTVTVPTVRLVELRWCATLSGGDSSDCIVAMSVDGAKVMQFFVTPPTSGRWDYKECRHVVRLSPGTHTIAFSSGQYWGGDIMVHASDDKLGSNACTGVICEAIDQGIAGAA